MNGAPTPNQQAVAAAESAVKADVASAKSKLVALIGKVAPYLALAAGLAVGHFVKL